MSRRLALFGAAVLTAACGPRRRGSAPDPVIIIFENQSLDQADVFAVGAGSQSMRIGTVYGGRTEMLRFPADAVGAGSVSFVARIFASSRTPRSGPITLSRGDTIQVRLPSDQRMLSVLPYRE